MKFEKEVPLKSLICQFEHGFKALSRSNLISSSGFHISVAGLLGIAGFVLALKDSKLSRLSSLDWLPKTDNGSPKLRLVPGLQNLGNNCFLNVILQVTLEYVVSLGFLVAWLPSKNTEQRRESRKTNTSV